MFPRLLARLQAAATEARMELQLKAAECESQGRQLREVRRLLDLEAAKRRSDSDTAIASQDLLPLALYAPMGASNTRRKSSVVDERPNIGMSALEGLDFQAIPRPLFAVLPRPHLWYSRIPSCETKRHRAGRRHLQWL